MGRLLEDKVAVVFGGSGAVGSATARAFAREGASVLVTGMTAAKVDAVVDEIRSAGGDARPAVVDALDAAAVQAAVDDAVAAFGRVDVCYTAVGIDNGDQGVALVDLDPETYLRPVREYAAAHFHTARAASRPMRAQGHGVILALSAPMARMPTALTGAFTPAHAAVEAMIRQLAAELGPDGVRVAGVRPTGMPDSARERGSHTADVWGRAAERMGTTLSEMLPAVGAGGLLGTEMTTDELAEVTTFLASDRARVLTGTVLNASGGVVVD